MNQDVPDIPQPNRKFIVLSLASIILVGFLIYANSLNGQFLWDDESLVQYNPYIKSWSHLPKIFTSQLGSIAKEDGAFYRPIQTFTYLIDYSIWQLNVFGYHLVNVLWHVLAALSIYGLVQVLFQNGKLALLTALLFVTHPIHTEAVSYISGRADSLVTFFMFSSFILYLRHDQKPQIMVLGLMAASYFLALLSKEYSFILPALIWFYHYSFKKPVDKKAFSVLIGTVLIYSLWRGMVIGVGSMSEGIVPTFAQRLPGVFVAMATYFRLLVLPFHLHMEYGGILFSFNEPMAIAGMVLTLLVIIVALRKREQDRFLFFSVGWFFISLLPSSNLFFSINAYMAEHWLYVPSIGFCLIVARFLINCTEKQNLKVGAVIVIVGILCFFSVLTIRQNRYWSNGINFYQKMLYYAPDSSRLYNNLAKAYHDAGKNDDLIELLKKAIQKQPDNALAHNNLGNAYKGIGQYNRAVYSYQQAITIDPEHAGPYFNLSTIYADVLNRREEAVQLLHKAIQLSPYFSKSYTKLGIIYIEQGQNEKAIALLNKALKLNPDDHEIYHGFGYIYMSTGDIGNAKKMYKKAIEINPNYVEAYHDLAIIYFSEKNYRLAIKYCDQSVAMGYVDETLLNALKPFR